MDKQIRLNFDDLGEVIEIDENEDKAIEDESDDEIDNEEELLYKKRLYKLVNDISNYENFSEVQISKEGKVRLQQVSKLLISILIIETIDDLKKDSRKKIMPKHVDASLDKILNHSSAIDIVLDLLNKDLDKLKNLKRSTAINRAMKFINE